MFKAILSKNVINQTRFMATRGFAARGPGGVASQPGANLDHSDRTLIDQRDPVQMRNFLEDLKEDYPNLLRHAAWRGDAKANFKFAMRDVNSYLRDNYKQLMHDVGVNIFPLLYLNDADPGEIGTGTTLTLYTEDGVVHRYVPTDKTYETLKDLSHQVFGLFTYVGPYFQAPNSIGWVGPLKGFQEKVQAALFSAGSSGLSPDLQERALRMLNQVNDYINLVVNKQRAELGDYQDFCKKITPDVEYNMKLATKYQAEAIVPLLEEIRAKLGKEWEQTYFLLPTVWPVAGINIRIQLLETVTTERHIRTHLITAENAFTADEARKTLGRVVGDRALAQVVFGTEDPELAKHVYALSSPEDLMSGFADESIKQFLATRY